VRPLAAAWVVVVAAMGGVLGWLATTPVEAPVVEVGVQIPPPETAVASVPASPAPRAPAPVGAPDARSPDPEEGALRGISRETADAILPRAEPRAPVAADPAPPPSPPGARQSEPEAQAAPDRARVLNRTDVMVPAPHPALVEESPLGLLPIIGPDGRESWQVYARPFDDSDSRPTIAVVMRRLGLSRSYTNQVIQLPGQVTLAFAPEAAGLDEWIDLARTAGHEVLLELPMEPESFPNDDPGPRALLTSVDPEDNLRRLDWLLTRFVGYVGVTNHMGGGFAKSLLHLEPVLQAIKARGLLYLDSTSPGLGLPGELADQLGLMRATSDIELDTEASRLAIQQRFDEVEKIARERGFAVAIAQPYPVTVELLRKWLPSLEENDLVVAPLTAVTARRFSG
jgi:hypothetical protein